MEILFLVLRFEQLEGCVINRKINNMKIKEFTA